MTKQPFTDKCSCDDSKYWENRCHELEAILEHINCGKPIDQPATQRGIITERLPVAEAKIQLKLKELEDAEKEIKQLEKWMSVLGIWFKNLKKKYDSLEDKYAKLREGMI